MCVCACDGGHAGISSYVMEVMSHLMACALNGPTFIGECAWVCVNV